jgi:hypothetical protein
MKYKICKIKNCNKEHAARGYCANHYAYFRYVRLLNAGKCTMCGKKAEPRRFCKKHRDLWNANRMKKRHEKNLREFGVERRLDRVDYEGSRYKKCLICHKIFKKPVYLAYKNWDKRKYCSIACRHKGNSIYRVGEKAAHWKGDKVGYLGLHQWINKIMGKPKQCEKCGRIVENQPKAIHWANKSHQYKRDKNDWMRLCCSCHKKYDLRRIKCLAIG